jgi:hypothetical protein
VHLTWNGKIGMRAEFRWVIKLGIIHLQDRKCEGMLTYRSVSVRKVVRTGGGWN